MRVLVVDDSPTARLALTQAIDGPDFQVVGVAASGTEALKQVRRLHPDVITMDVYLGSDDGVRVTSEIMRAAPTPILIVTGVNPKDPQLIFRALEAGALEVLPKLPARGSSSYAMERERLLRCLRTLSSVPLVTQRARRSVPSMRLETPQVVPRLIAIGASTGGPPLLEHLFEALPKPYPVPIAVSQHVLEGLADSLAWWLEKRTGHPSVVCNRAMTLEPGTVYFAPPEAHLHLRDATTLAPVEGPERRFQKSSIDELFESAARVLGPRLTAIQLTGMGKDGADGLLEVRRRGGVTVAQRPDTCVVDSMPATAIEMGAAQMICGPDEIKAHLLTIARRASGTSR